MNSKLIVFNLKTSYGFGDFCYMCEQIKYGFTYEKIGQLFYNEELRKLEKLDLLYGPLPMQRHIYICETMPGSDTLLRLYKATWVH